MNFIEIFSILVLLLLGYIFIPKIKNTEFYKKIEGGKKRKLLEEGNRICVICLKMGADDYIAKPIDIDELFQLINKHLNLRKSSIIK